MRFTQQQRDEAVRIIQMTLPRVYYGQRDAVPFVGGMHFLISEDVDGNIHEIYECRGYHRRKLIEVVEGAFVMVNPLSVYAEGVFKSRATSLNQFEQNPLLCGVYKREFMDGWTPEKDRG